ncbi:hypothetical protein RB195_015400 [Necator americanus]|uniref:MRG domain-containing protein n=1 Tax=Necator americanus TaxID=51031 RepID=A0ABR1E4Y9_NECAM
MLPQTRNIHENFLSDQRVRSPGLLLQLGIEYHYAHTRKLLPYSYHSLNQLCKVLKLEMNGGRSRERNDVIHYINDFLRFTLVRFFFKSNDKIVISSANVMQP